MERLFCRDFLLAGGCSGPVQYSSASSPAVGTAWGEDVRSTVTGVSVERAERDPAEVILINYSAKHSTGYDRVYSIRISDLNMPFAMLILIPYLLPVFTTHQLANGNIGFLPK